MRVVSPPQSSGKIQSPALGAFMRSAMLPNTTVLVVPPWNGTSSRRPLRSWTSRGRYSRPIHGFPRGTESDQGQRYGDSAGSLKNLWANERKAMLTATSLSALLLAIAGAQQGGDAGRAASAQLSKELGESSSVSIYYVSRTGEYSYTREKIKEQSTLSIRRQCGGNCARLMEPVALHLRGAVPSNCPIGQQTVLIEIGDRSSVVYSQGGRSIRYQGKCYFSRTNIRQVIRKTEVIPP